MKESARYLLPILVFVAAILTIGTVGYRFIEHNVSLSDAFYMTVTAITPTQFDEVHELSVPGRYFTVLLVFCGFGAVVAFATQFARLIIQSELEGVGVITRKQMRRRIKRMKNHYIVCGYGEIGGAICGELKEQQIPFVVIADDESSVSAIEREGYACVNNNPTADCSLKEAGIERAVGVIAILADDADNLFIALAARELNPKILIIARGEDSGVEDRILRAGADIVVSPMKLGGRQIAELIKQQAGGDATSDALQSQSHVMGLQLKVYHHSKANSMLVSDILRATNAVGVAGMKRDDGKMENCQLGVEVHAGDALVLIMQVADSSDQIHKMPSGRKILLADDHRALRLLFSRKLASVGHDVMQAASGDEALRLAQAHPPDLIVLDVDMPGQDGYQVCRAIRSAPILSGIPIILYSGQETEEFLIRGREAGATKCVRKTSKSSELLEQIDDVFATNLNTVTPAKELRSDASDSLKQPLFDIAVAMENVQDDPKLLDELISIVLEETPPLMAMIRESIDPFDRAALSRSAHTLKGSLLVFGAADAASAAESLEYLDSDLPPNEVRRLHNDFETQIETLMKELQQYSERAAATVV